MEFHPLVIAALTGLLGGFVFSIPIGPTNITIINEGARRGFKWGLFVSLGAVVMDLGYCGIAFGTFSYVGSSSPLRTVMELGSFAAVLWLGLKFIRAKHLPETTPVLEAVEHRFHPHTAFMIGFSRVLGNPGVLLFWITFAATLAAHEWIARTWQARVICVAGCATGAATWFILLSFIVGLGRGKFSEKTLVRLSHISGLCLLGIALLIAIRLVRTLIAGA